MNRIPNRRLLLLLALLFASAAFDELGEDDLACEGIAAEISECCDLDPARFQCDFDDACGTPTTFTPGEIECLDALSCDLMRSGGVCDFLITPEEERGQAVCLD